MTQVQFDIEVIPNSGYARKTQVIRVTRWTLRGFAQDRDVVQTVRVPFDRIEATVERLTTKWWATAEREP